MCASRKKEGQRPEERARAPRALERLEQPRNDDAGIGELLRFLSVNAHHRDDDSNGGVQFQRPFRRRPSIGKTVPTKAADWEIVPTTVPPWVLDQDDGSEEGYELGRRLRV